MRVQSMSDFTRYVCILKSVRCQLTHLNLQNPTFRIILGTINKYIMKIDSMTHFCPKLFLEMLKGMASIMIEISMHLSKTRSIYTMVLFYTGELILNVCKCIHNPMDHKHVCIVLNVLVTSISSFLTDNDAYYETYSERWNNDKRFLKELGRSMMISD
jgi:hypothetical protein